MEKMAELPKDDLAVSSAFSFGNQLLMYGKEVIISLFF